MTDTSSPPPSPTPFKLRRGSSSSPMVPAMLSPVSLARLDHPTLPFSAVNKNLYYHFPTPPNSPPRPAYLPMTPRAVSSPIVTSHPRMPHSRNNSRTGSTRARRRSSLSTSIHIRQLSLDEFGPPPYPAPTTPLPPTPGAPRVPFTTPALERTRYSAYELYDSLLRLQREQTTEELKQKRHSAPPKQRIPPLTTTPDSSRDIDSDIAKPESEVDETVEDDSIKSTLNRL